MKPLNPAMKKFLVISAKQAVGALFGNATLAAALPKIFNFHDHAGVVAVLKLTLGLIVAAEAKVWVPKIAAWYNSPSE